MSQTNGELWYVAAVKSVRPCLGRGYAPGATVYVKRTPLGFDVYSGHGFTLRHLSAEQAEACLTTARDDKGKAVAVPEASARFLRELVRINLLLED
jgi:hypothetical protein